MHGDLLAPGAARADVRWAEARRPGVVRGENGRGEPGWPGLPPTVSGRPEVRRPEFGRPPESGRPELGRLAESRHGDPQWPGPERTPAPLAGSLGGPVATPAGGTRRADVRRADLRRAEARRAQALRSEGLPTDNPNWDGLPADGPRRESLHTDGLRAPSPHLASPHTGPLWAEVMRTATAPAETTTPGQASPRRASSTARRAESAPRRADESAPRRADGGGRPAETTGRRTDSTGRRPEATSRRAEATGRRPEATSRRAEATSRRAETTGRRAGRKSSRSPQTLSLSVPQVGIAGALGLATIAAPLTGTLAAPAAKTATNTVVQASSIAAAPAFPRLQPSMSNAVDDVRLIPGDNAMSSVPAMLGAPRTVLVGRAARGGERPVLPGCDGSVPIENVSNGKVPSADLCTLWDGDNQLRADAAIAMAKLNIAYRKHFGHDICVSDGYRTLSQQYRVKAIKGGLAAAPGTSEHGWGLAADLCDGVNRYGSATYLWLRANAPAYGWDNPDWARPGGSGPSESWHWEFVEGQQGVSGGD